MSVVSVVCPSDERCNGFLTSFEITAVKGSRRPSEIRAELVFFFFFYYVRFIWASSAPGSRGGMQSRASVYRRAGAPVQSSRTVPPIERERGKIIENHNFVIDSVWRANSSFFFFLENFSPVLKRLIIIELLLIRIIIYYNVSIENNILYHSKILDFEIQ